MKHTVQLLNRRGPKPLTRPTHRLAGKPLVNIDDRPGLRHAVPEEVLHHDGCSSIRPCSSVKTSPAMSRHMIFCMLTSNPLLGSVRN